MRGGHSFSTDISRRRRVVLFAIGAIGIQISTNFGPVLATVTGRELFNNVTFSFVLAATAVYLILSRGLWTLPGVSTLVGSPPDLSGEWEGHLYTNTEKYDDEDVVAIDDLGHGLVKMEAGITISQTWDQILVELDGPNSDSESTGATILTDDGGQQTLIYNYDNTPVKFRSDLEQHQGTATLDYCPDEDSLKGTYYTGPSRENCGRIEVHRVSD